MAYKKAGGLAESDVRQINILIADDNACVKRTLAYFILNFIRDELTAFTANKLDESTTERATRCRTNSATNVGIFTCEQ